jgi:chaperone required for assembly of F1-ATPase
MNRLLTKFWKSVTIVKHSGKYRVMLDSKPVKTPLGTVIDISAETLALLTAAEWDMQKRLLKPHSLPIVN